MSYDLSDYVDVAERITIFRDKHPDGSLQSSFQFTDRDGTINGVVVCAHAYRTPDDERPGIGHSFCPIPGTTRFTQDSEIENAETSAWGRAIVAALAADTKRGVASANEIAAKTVPSHRPPQQQTAGGATSPASPAGDFVIKFGKHKGQTIAQIAEADAGWLDWYLENGKFEDVTAQITAFLFPDVEQELADTFDAVSVPVGDEDIPFLTTIDGLGN